MPCSDCGYDLRDGQAECPRCLYHSHMRQTPDVPAPTLIVGEPTASAPALPAPPARRHWAVMAACLAALGALLLARPMLRVNRAAQAADTGEQRARSAFARADGPCRRGADAPCRAGIAALLALRDRSDASLLIGDIRVARYLQIQPGGGGLEDRWRRDHFTAGELMALGEQARRQNLTVYRSFWLYANVKQNHMPVPTLTINNDHVTY